jgi:hypothetical protein
VREITCQSSQGGFGNRPDHNRNRRGRRRRSPRAAGGPGVERLRLCCDEFAGEEREALVGVVGEPELDLDGLPFDLAEFGEPGKHGIYYFGRMLGIRRCARREDRDLRPSEDRGVRSLTSGRRPVLAAALAQDALQ